MEDLSYYTEEEIYEMLKNGDITIDDLDYYIKNGTIKSDDLELYLKDGLIRVAELSPYIASGIISTDDVASYINSGIIEVKDIETYIKSGTIDADRLAEQVENVTAVEAIEAIDESTVVEEPQEIEVQEVIPAEEVEIPVVEAVIENPEQVQDSEVQQIVEEPETFVNEAPNDFNEPVEVEQPEEIIPTTDNEFVNDNIAEVYNNINSNTTYDEANYAMEETYKYCLLAGMAIRDITLDGKNGRGPYISFEINHESKQILDHLMNELYLNGDNISLEFMRDMSTKRELFTISIDPANMSKEEFYAHVRNTFQSIYQTVQTTRKDFDYEQTMPQGLKNVKDRFRNDDPDIGQDFTIGYVRNDGKDSYYIVANNNEKAKEYARSIGYDIKNSQGANVFEVETNGNVIGTKLEGASTDLSTDKQVMDIASNGVANLDIYGSVEKDPRVQMIENFIETSNDPHLMCILNVEVPTNNPSQRIVTMKSEMGGNETVVFPNGNEFDQKVMPRIIDTYAENNPIERENISTNASDSFDMASIQVYSENNTTLMVNGYSQNEVNKMVSDIESKEKTNTNTNTYTNEKAKVYQKTYQPNNNNEPKAAFVSMPVLLVICILFILMVSLIIFAG